MVQLNGLQSLRFLLKLGLVWLVFLSAPLVVTADEMKQAVEEAAQTLATGKLTGHTDRSIIIEVINLHSKKRDQTAKAIETQLYQALGKEFKDFKLLFLEDSLAGINLNKAIFIHGTYEPKGKNVTAIFTAVIGMKGEAVGQAQVTFDAPKNMQEALVAVLDIEARDINENQRRAYSDLFRSELQKTGKIKLASSAEVAKMSPDAIQESYQCTRDECATIIGEQLGVDRVVSTSVIKLSKDKYMISSKVMDIKNGSILSSDTLEHRGDLSNLGDSLTLLAKRLVGGVEGSDIATAAAAGSGMWIWHTAALGSLVVSLSSSSNAAKQFDTLAAENLTLETQYNNAVSQAQLTTLKEKQATNQAKMKTLNSQMTQFNALAVTAGLWETYLLLFGGETEVASIERQGLHFAVQPSPEPGTSAGLSFSYLW